MTCTGPSCTHESHAIGAPDELDSLLGAIAAVTRDAMQYRGTKCAFDCGWTHEASAVEVVAEACREHVKACPKHPIREVEAQLAQAQAEAAAMRRALVEYVTRGHSSDATSALSSESGKKLLEEVERAKAEVHRLNEILIRFPQLSAERDSLRAQVETLTKERDEARGALERSARLVEEMMAPLFEREHIAAAIRSAPTEQAKPVCSECGGTKKVADRCDDPQCGDSTWDHECNLGDYSPCPKCSGGGR